MGDSAKRESLWRELEGLLKETVKNEENARSIVQRASTMVENKLKKRNRSPSNSSDYDDDDDDIDRTMQMLANEQSAPTMEQKQQETSQQQASSKAAKEIQPSPAKKVKIEGSIDTTSKGRVAGDVGGEDEPMLEPQHQVERDESHEEERMSTTTQEAAQSSVEEQALTSHLDMTAVPTTTQNHLSVDAAIPALSTTTNTRSKSPSKSPQPRLSPTKSDAEGFKHNLRGRKV